MGSSTVNLMSLRIVVSCIGFVGNIFLITSMLKNNFSKVKSFELFLLGLATANLEEIIIINIYDIINILPFSTTTYGTWWCWLLKFMIIIGEINSILFTVLICIFRYQKLRDAKRVSLPVFLDSIRSAWLMSGVCVMLSTLLSLPIFVMSHPNHAENTTRSIGCPPDFFHCSETHCPVLHHLYKYFFIVLCHLLPLIIVTVTSCLILTILLNQRKTVTPADTVSRSSQFSRKKKDAWLYRSTVAVLAAMGLFQVDWTLYLIFKLAFSSTDSPLWGEIEFFLSTSYTSISPYVYGLGYATFSLKTCKK
ncbi:uncharacterized protein ora6 [Pholidichthys leucotaenia]